MAKQPKTKMSGKEARYLIKENRINMAWLAEQLGISLEVLEYCIGQSMKNDRPIFNYLKVMRKHADEAIRTILDALKTDDPHEPSAHENEILL